MERLAFQLAAEVTGVQVRLRSARTLPLSRLPMEVSLAELRASVGTIGGDHVLIVMEARVLPSNEGRDMRLVYEEIGSLEYEFPTLGGG